MFKRAGESDLTIKVGPGETAASFRIAGPEEVTELLAQLLAKRAG